MYELAFALAFILKLRHPANAPFGTLAYFIRQTCKPEADSGIGGAIV